MEDILNKEPVKRVQKKLNEFSNELKAIVLNSSARTAQQAAVPAGGAPPSSAVL